MPAINADIDDRDKDDDQWRNSNPNNIINSTYNVAKINFNIIEKYNINYNKTKA